VLDEPRLRIAHVLLGGRTRLFDNLDPEQVNLENAEVIDTREVTHFTFRVSR
jgi:hypothetical protein